MTHTELYYTFRAEIHAKHLSRETLESKLARALAVIKKRTERDREEAAND